MIEKASPNESTIHYMEDNNEQHEFEDTPTDSAADMDDSASDDVDTDSDEPNDNSELEDFSADAHFSIEGNFLYYEGAEEPVLIMTGLATVCAVIVKDDDSTLYKVRFRCESGREGTFLIKGEDLAGNISKLLTSKGLFVHKEAKVREYLVQTAARCAKAGVKELIDRVGWHHDHAIFFSGRQLHYDPDRINIDRFEEKVNPLAKMTTSGTVDEWKANIGVHAIANDIPLFAICFGLSSVLLDRTNLGSVAVNFFGRKGSGKTLTMQIAASVLGNGISPADAAQRGSYMSRFAATPNAYEPLLASYGCLPAMLDEFGETAITDIGRTIYTMTGGTGKARATSNMEMAPSFNWLLHILICGEVSLARYVTDSGKELQGGQSDRAADIPLPKNGLFADPGSFKDFNALTAHLKDACKKFYGTVGEEFIGHCLVNDEFIQAELQSLSVIEDKLAPAECGPGERRMVKHFALSAITGMLAVDFGLLECSRQRILDAHVAVTRLWWGYRADSMALVEAFLRESAAKIKFGRPSISDATLPAIIDESLGLIIIPLQAFNKAFDEPAKVSAELASLGLLCTDQDGRNTHRFCNHKLRTYALFAEKFEDVLKELRPVVED